MTPTPTHNPASGCFRFCLNGALKSKLKDIRKLLGFLLRHLYLLLWNKLRPVFVFCLKILPKGKKVWQFGNTLICFLEELDVRDWIYSVFVCLPLIRRSVCVLVWQKLSTDTAAGSRWRTLRSPLTTPQPPLAATASSAAGSACYSSDTQWAYTETQKQI